METKDLQTTAVDTVDILDKKFNVNRDAQLNFTQMVEEIGELAKDVNMPKLRHKEPDKENLKGEFADVFLQFAKLADLMNVDLEQAVLNKIQTLKQRHELE